VDCPGRLSLPRQRDYPGALQTYNEAQKRLPNSSFVLENMAFVERRLGLWKEAEAHYKKAAELDPRNLGIFVEMGSDFLNYLRRFDEAQAALDRALEISPNDQSAIVGKAGIFQSEGRLDEAAKDPARIPADSAGDEVVFARADQASLRPGEAVSNNFLVRLGHCQEWAGQAEKARASYTRLIQTLKPSANSTSGSDIVVPFYLAIAYAGLGDKTNALDEAHRAVAELANDAIAKPFGEAALAQIQARFGDLDSAIAALPHLLEVPAGLTRPICVTIRCGIRCAKIRASKNSARKSSCEPARFRSAIDSNGRTIWIADAHRDGKRFVAHADEKLTAFMELEAAIRGGISLFFFVFFSKFAFPQCTEAMRAPWLLRKEKPLRPRTSGRLQNSLIDKATSGSSISAPTT
jgi:tetratricopeptide (TPR) repeat protein